MITEITNQYNVDLSGDVDNEVPILNFTLPNNDWTLSIQVKGTLDGSQYGNLFQDGANYIFDSDTDPTHGRVFGAFQQDYFPIPELEALGEDEWATITITRVGNLLTYYVNGTNYGSITHSNLPSDIETINGWSGGGHHLAPDVANFRVFEGAATAEEVLELVEVPYTHVYGFSNRLFVDNDFVVASHRWVSGQKQGADFLDPDDTAGDGWIYINDDNAVNWYGDTLGRNALARTHTPDEKIQASAKLIGNGGDVDIVGNTYKLRIMSVMGQLIGEYDAIGTATGVKVADDVGFSFSNDSYENSPFFEIYAEGEIYSDLEGSSPEAPDTSNEDDSNSNNGDTNETQPMEEIIMSYSFTNDLSGGTHPTEISCTGDVTEAGTATVGFEENNCRVKKFLSAVEAKGMRVCGDDKLQDGELFLQDGTAASSLIKEVSMCFGRLVDQAEADADAALSEPLGLVVGQFIAMNPEDLGITPTGDPIATEPTTGLGDSEYGSENVEVPAAVAVQGEGKWFLKLLRPSGSATFKEMEAVNNLLTFSNMDGRVQSILEAMQEVEDLQAAVHAAMELKAIASKDDVDALEARLDLEIVHLAQHLTILESSLKDHIDAGDLAVKTFVEARLTEMVLSVEDAYSETRFHAEATVANLNNGVTGPCPVLEFTYDASKFIASRPEEQWLWGVDIIASDGVMRQDLEALFTIHPAESKIKLDAMECESSELDGAKFVFNAIYTGAAQPVIESNANGDVFTNPAYVAKPLPLDPDGADSDSSVAASLVSDGAPAQTRIVAQP